MKLIYTGEGPSKNKPVADLSLDSKVVTEVNTAELGLSSTSFNVEAVVDSAKVKSVAFSTGWKESYAPFAYWYVRELPPNSCTDSSIL